MADKRKCFQIGNYDRENKDSLSGLKCEATILPVAIGSQIVFTTQNSRT
jgi:hypothetical protein